jgi:radical SAM enzyme (TIGR01210 family)
MQGTIQNYPFSAETDQRYSPVYGEKISQLTCVVPGGGCVYYRAQKGDVCPFCSFPAFSRHVVRGEGHEDDFSAWTLTADVYKRMYDKSLKVCGPADKVAIFNGGSFFPESELPSGFQEHVCQDIASRPQVRQLMVEAYPAYIARRKLDQTREMLAGKDLMVGIGFESQNDFVRNTLLKKRIARDQFEAKVRMLQEAGVQVFVYAFLKAPGLTERQALDEALETCAYLHNLGVDEIALSCAFVPPGSALEQQYHAGEFRPPWLWSILEIQRRAEAFGWPLSIGGFEDFPPPVAGPSNCERCDSDALELIERVRATGRLPGPVDVKCACKGRWARQTEK